jgi:hypothetical protein
MAKPMAMPRRDFSTSMQYYVITHHRPMLEATRRLMDIQLWEECKVWAEVFGIVYRDCLGAVHYHHYRYRWCQEAGKQRRSLSVKTAGVARVSSHNILYGTKAEATVRYGMTVLLG